MHYVQQTTHDKPAEAALDSVLRFLDSRCTQAPQKVRVEKAVRQWVDNAGLLPQGVKLKDSCALDVEQDLGARALQRREGVLGGR